MGAGVPRGAAGPWRSTPRSVTACPPWGACSRPYADVGFSGRGLHTCRVGWRLQVDSNLRVEVAAHELRLAVSCIGRPSSLRRPAGDRHPLRRDPPLDPVYAPSFPRVLPPRPHPGRRGPAAADPPSPRWPHPASTQPEPSQEVPYVPRPRQLVSLDNSARMSALLHQHSLVGNDRESSHDDRESSH